MKHICIFFIYHNIEHIIESFESIQKSDVDYFIVENKSNNSEQIEKYFSTKKLKGYIQFQKNISNNAIQTFLADYKNLLLDYDYITITDGDLKVEDATSTFEELIKNLNIEEKIGRSVGVSCVDLELSNFPHHVPGSEKWLPYYNCKETEEYIECPSGIHLMTIKIENIDFLYQKWGFRDITIKDYVYSKGYKWVTTKINKAYHLTWDLYYEGNPYYDDKMKQLRRRLWKHSRWSPYLEIK
jgi:hypothetical protein